jgi:oxygen-independent coproporphyrinogen-3 oxidase
MSSPSNNALGIYVSIPFCRSKCTYCNFASGVYPASAHGRYIERVIEELHQTPDFAEKMGVELPRRVDSIYLGGGTPSLLAPELIDRLFAALRSAFRVLPAAEITVECAPAQLSDETLAAFVRAGVNRASLGVQSFVDAELRVSGRLHTRASALETIGQLRRFGIHNLNLDLIAGLAGQTEASWEESLATLLEANPAHASVYMLEVDEDSRLGRELLAGGERYHAGEVPEDGAITAMYERAIERLAAAGLMQYEISNFARPGFESRHNLRYWQRRPYLGLGLDASSMLHVLPGKSENCAQGDLFAPADEAARKRADQQEKSRQEEDRYVLRIATTAELQAYLDGSEPAETAWLSPDRQHEEAWFLGLRRNEGVKLASIRREFGVQRLEHARAAIEKLQPGGLIDFDGKTVHLTPKGRLFSNEVFQEFLGTAEDEPAE